MAPQGLDVRVEPYLEPILQQVGRPPAERLMGVREEKRRNVPPVPRLAGGPHDAAALMAEAGEHHQSDPAAYHHHLEREVPTPNIVGF